MAGITKISDLHGVPSHLREFLQQFLYGTTAGAPTAASTGVRATGTNTANTGSMLLDRTNGVIYKNTGTKALPVWNAVGSVSQSEIDAASLDGTVVKVGAAENVIGAIPVVHVFNIDGGVDEVQAITLTHKTRIIDWWGVMEAAGVTGGTVTVQNAGTAISDVVDTSSLGDEDVFRPAELDTAQQDVAASAALQVSSLATGDDNPVMTVYVLGIRIA